MKNIHHPSFFLNNFILQALLPIGILFLVFHNLYSTPLQEEEEKARVRIELNYFKLKDDSSYLAVKVLTRIERQYQPVPGVIINLFLNQQTKAGMMGNITTDQEGQGVFILPPKFYQAKDTLTSMAFMARLQNDPNYQDRITSIEIRDAKVTIIPIDSLKQIKVRLTQKDSSNHELPIEGADIKCYVQRMFSRLPVGEEYNITDDNGEVNIQIPPDLPGDESGNLELIVGLEEDDTYGNITAHATLQWGSDVLIGKDTFDERTMWSSREKTPIYLLIWPNLMLLIVWGVIVYLLVQLRKIYRDTKMVKNLNQ